MISQTRGSDASGLALQDDLRVTVLKRSSPADKFINLKEYKNLVSDYDKTNKTKIAIGHSRMVTNGSQETHENNQPVISESIVGIHNGIVVNVDKLWNENQHLHRKYEVDTEIIFELMEDFCNSGLSIQNAARRTFQLIEGATSIAALFTKQDLILVGTNNGSLYSLLDKKQGLFIFASEHQILLKLISKMEAGDSIDSQNIQHITAGNGQILNTKNLELNNYNFTSEQDNSLLAAAITTSEREIIDLKTTRAPAKTKPIQNDSQQRKQLVWAESKFPYDTSFADSLGRCTKCLLPETMPFITFNSEGVCSYCQHYKKLNHYGNESLSKVADSIRSKDGKYDCIVGLSGGRDSMYGLHYIKNVLKLNPIAYTYDWGMVTDLARRNISRICGKLGVEHLLVSANIQDKRKYVQKNVSAWLKKPDLGMIPLFMAGDKAYFYHASRLKKEQSISTIILCENMLERTDFKIGFAGLRPSHIDPDRHYTLSQSNIFRLGSYYAGQYLCNPSYINQSLLDTLFAYACYYLIKRDYLNLYRYIPWQEDEIIGTLVRDYDWEMAEDTTSTWRIGDGTSAFYNYVYYHVAGFTENETFRSNQIREGIMSREQASKLCFEENKPRYKTIQWYCNTINVNFEHLVKTVNSVPRLTTKSS